MNRNFYILWFGQFVSVIGTQGFAIAELFWTKHATNSATIMGLLMVASMTPILVLGPLGGVVADRFSRKKIIIVCDVINAVVVCALSLTLYLIPHETAIIIGCLFCATIVLSVSGAFFGPAIASAIPDIVIQEKIDRANSLHQSSSQISLFIGQGLGGLLYQILGAPLLFLIDGLTYLFAGVSESFVDIPRAVRKKKVAWGELGRQTRADLKEGVRYVWNNNGLRVIILVFAVLNFFSMPFVLLLPFYLEDFLKVGLEWYGYFLAALGVGTLTGYFVVGWVKPEGKTRSKMVTFSLFCISIMLGSIGFIKIVYLSFFGMFVAGMMIGAININILSILQISTPTHIRGRVFGLVATVTGVLAPVGMGVSGVAADLTHKNVPLIFTVCGAGLLVISIFVLITRDFRDYFALENQSKPEAASSLDREEAEE